MEVLAKLLSYGLLMDHKQQTAFLLAHLFIHLKRFSQFLTANMSQEFY
jgi:hypothetical protein